MIRRTAASAALVATAALATFCGLPLLRGNLPAELAAGAFALACVIAGAVSLAGAFKRPDHHAACGDNRRRRNR